MRRVRGWPSLARLQRAGLTIGDNVFIGDRAWLDPDFCYLITIDDDAVLSVGVTILTHDSSTRRHLGYSRLAPVRIGRRCFIGAGAVILPGVTIGDDSIVGAGSVVRASVPPGMVAAGNPAKVVKSLDEFIADERERLDGAVKFQRQGYSVNTGLTDERRDEVLRALERGRAYVR